MIIGFVLISFRFGKSNSNFKIVLLLNNFSLSSLVTVFVCSINSFVEKKIALIVTVYSLNKPIKHDFAVGS